MRLKNSVLNRGVILLEWFILTEIKALVTDSTVLIHVIRGVLLRGVSARNPGQNPTGQNPTLTKPHRTKPHPDKTPSVIFS